MSDYSSTFKDYIDQLNNGTATSMVPLLNMFSLNGDPMNLKFHFQLEPMYNVKTSKRMVWRCARQVGKSYGIGSRGIIRAGLVPGFNLLYIQPRCDQIKRFSQTVIKPLLRTCAFNKALVDRSCEQNVMTKEFTNGSRFHMEYVFLNPDRVRGISGVAEMNIDECQDVDYAHIPVIAETMSATIRYGFHVYTGTSKTTDCTLEALWQDSSMAEWAIPCTHCNKTNIPSMEQDLWKMIGKKTCICAKCGRPVDPRYGYYVHAFPDRRQFFSGYHISQVTHPLHYAIPSKWQDLLYKMQTYDRAKFLNEVLGEACDESVKLLGKNDIIAASNHLTNKLAEAIAASRQYKMLVLGVDWSGGGELSHSYTTIAVVGTKPGEDVLDCVYAERIPHGLKPEDEAKMIAEYANMFQVAYIAHDYTGAGYLRESLMCQAGIPPGQIMPFTYVCAPTKNVITYNQGSANTRTSWSMDKARSLMVICAMIKARKVTLPDWEHAQNVLGDLLALQENPKELERGNILFLITAKPKTPDDFAHALNYACSCIWHSKQAYPNLAEAAKFEITADQLAMADPGSILFGKQDR
jgi:hypothetical protein